MHPRRVGSDLFPDGSRRSLLCGSSGGVWTHHFVRGRCGAENGLDQDGEGARSVCLRRHVFGAGPSRGARRPFVGQAGGGGGGAPSGQGTAADPPVSGIWSRRDRRGGKGKLFGAVVAGGDRIGPAFVKNASARGGRARKSPFFVEIKDEGKNFSLF